MSITTIWRKLVRDKRYREEYAIAMLKRMIPYQTRAIRKKRGWSQAKLAEEAKVTQGVISRAEDPDYGNLTLTTIGRIAAGYDLAVIVKLVPFSELVRYCESTSEREFANLPTFEEENATNRLAQESREAEHSRRILYSTESTGSGAIAVMPQPSVVQPGPVKTRVRRESRRKRGPSLTVSNDEQRKERSNKYGGGSEFRNDSFQYTNNPFGNPAAELSV